MKSKYSRKIMVMGHRGSCTVYPENTIVSFSKALEIGVDIIEFDINLSKDKIPMVIHDAKLDRTTDGSGAVADFTAEELKRFDAGAKKGDIYKGERIPTLDEVLDLMEDYPDVLLNIEIKGSSKEAAAITIDILKKRRFAARSYLACFDAAILHYIKEIAPDIKTQGFPAECMGNFIEGANGTYSKMDYVGIPKDTLTSEMVEFFRSMNIIFGVWSIDDRETALKFIDTGIEIITSNSPDVVIDVLKERGLR